MGGAGQGAAPGACVAPTSPKPPAVPHLGGGDGMRAGRGTAPAPRGGHGDTGIGEGGAGMWGCWDVGMQSTGVRGCGMEGHGDAGRRTQGCGTQSPSCALPPSSHRRPPRLSPLGSPLSLPPPPRGGSAGSGPARRRRWPWGQRHLVTTARDAWLCAGSHAITSVNTDTQARGMHSHARSARRHPHAGCTHAHTRTHVCAQPWPCHGPSAGDLQPRAIWHSSCCEGSWMQKIN